MIAKSLHTSKWFKLLVERTLKSGDDEKLTSTHLQEIHCQRPFLKVDRARGRGWTRLLARGKMEKVTMSMWLRTVRLETEKKGVWRRRSELKGYLVVAWNGRRF